MSASGPAAAAGVPGRGPLWRRVVPLALIGAGLVVWRSPLLPQPHTLIWDRPVGPALASAEVQLWRGETLLARAEWPDASQGALTQQLTVRAGTLHVLSFVRLRDGTERRGVQEILLGGAEVVHAPLLPGGR